MSDIGLLTFRAPWRGASNERRNLFLEFEGLQKMPTSKSLAAWSLCAILGLVAASTASASNLVVDRGLPSDNLNNAAGSNRSNVSWAFGSTWFSGDDFVLPPLPGQTWRVDTLRVWVADGVVGTDTMPGDFLSSINLYVGAPGTAGAVVASGTIAAGSAITSNPNIVFTKVTYPDSGHTAFYEGNGGINYDLWQIDFNNLNLFIDGGTKTEFGVYGGANELVFLHASNAALSGTPQDGADNNYLAFDLDDLSTGGELIDSNGYGWDKSSDINVQVFATAVPEPSALISAGVGALIVGGAGLLRRRRRARG